MNLINKAYEINKKIIEVSALTGKGHLTSCLSCTEILISLYYGRILNVDPKNIYDSNRDRFILSKGHASLVLYAVLSDFGFFNKKQLFKFAQKEGIISTHTDCTIPGIDVTTGSLGQGFGIAAGIALAAKLNNKSYKTYVLLGDGECYEGSIWETAMFVAHNKLTNLITIIDYNKMCVSGFTKDVVDLDSLYDKWAAFGFVVISVDGHNIDNLINVFHFYKTDKPLLILAHTIKGHGVPSLANNSKLHGWFPKKEQTKDLLEELRKSYGY